MLFPGFTLEETLNDNCNAEITNSSIAKTMIWERVILIQFGNVREEKGAGVLKENGRSLTTTTATATRTSSQNIHSRYFNRFLTISTILI